MFLLITTVILLKIYFILFHIFNFDFKLLYDVKFNYFTLTIIILKISKLKSQM
jgi:hypothetical protein